MRVKIQLDTITDIGNFVVAVSHATGKHDKVYVTDGERCCINAKSFLGLVAAREFDELWCESEKDIYSAIANFVVT
jgi:hypothetical protein